MNIRSIPFLALALSSASILPSSPSITPSFTETQNQLYQAIEHDSKKEIERIIASVATSGNNDEEGFLLKAISNHNTEEIKQTIQKIITEGKNGIDPIVWAVLLGKPTAVKTLLDCGAKIDVEFVRYTIATNNIQTALVLIRGGVNISHIIGECMYLCIANYDHSSNVNTTLELIRELINRGYNINKPWNCDISKRHRSHTGNQFTRRRISIENQFTRQRIISMRKLIRASSGTSWHAINLVIKLHSLDKANNIIVVTRNIYMPPRLTRLMLAVEQGNIQVVQILLNSMGLHYNSNQKQ